MTTREVFASARASATAASVAPLPGAALMTATRLPPSPASRRADARSSTVTSLAGPAAAAVGAHEFIAGLPDGYDTDVRKRGGRLSAGPREGGGFLVQAELPA